MWAPKTFDELRARYARMAPEELQGSASGLLKSRPGDRAWLREAQHELHEMFGNLTLGRFLELADEELVGREHRTLRRALLERGEHELARLATQGAGRAVATREGAQGSTAAPTVPSEGAAPRRPELRVVPDAPATRPAARANAQHHFPDDPAGLRAWADARGVGALLDRATMEVLYPRWPGLFTGTVHPPTEQAPLGRLLTEPLRLQAGQLHPRLVEQRRVARQVLEAASDQVARIRDTVRRAEAEPPPEPALAELQRGLLRLWSRLAALPLFDFEAHLGQLWIADGSPLQLLMDRVQRQPHVEAALEIDQTGADLGVRGHCSCGQSGACLHLAAMVLLVLGVLQDRSVELRATLLALLSQAPWERALQRIANPPEEAVVPGEQLWWVLSVEELPNVELALYGRAPSKRGGTKKPKKLGAERLAQVRSSMGENDREILDWISAAGGADSPETHDRAMAGALRRLVGHPRVAMDTEALVPWSVALGDAEVVVRAEDGTFQLSLGVAGASLRPPELLALMEKACFDLAVTVDRESRRVLVTPLSEALLHSAATLALYAPRIPLAAKERLLEALPALERLAPVRFEGDFGRRELVAPPELVVRLSPEGPAFLEIEVGVRPLPGGPLFRPGAGPLEVVGPGGEGDFVVARRDHGQEIRMARERLAGVLPGLEALEHENVFSIHEPDHALELITALSDRPGITVEWLEKPWVVGRALAPKELRVEVSDRPDWFGLSGGIQVGEERLSLAVLLEAVRAGRRFVRLDREHWFRVSEELSSRLAPVEACTTLVRGEVQATRASLEALEAAADGLGSFERSGRWSESLERLRQAKTVVPVPPPGLLASLRPYQVEGHAWLSRLAAWGMGGCLADDMGLGKTLQTLAVLLDRAPLGPALVVAPTSVTHNWVREAERFAPTLRVRRASGPERARLLADLGPGDVLVTSYALLTRDVERLEALAFGTLVLDEAQAIKNPESLRAKAALRIKAEWRLALTGTPIENHLGELWAIFHVVAPEVLGGWAQFRERFALPIERGRDRRRAEALARALRPFILRRTKGEVARDLPPKTEVRVDVELTPEERGRYEDARLRAVAELSKLDLGLGQEERRFHVLAMLTRLRQLACHPGLADGAGAGSSAKLDRLVELVQAIVAAGQRVLVFSQFVRLLELARAALERAGQRALTLDGSTPADERQRRVERFQAGELPVFLISLKAGGSGLNLTAADNVIHLDPWWNPAVEDQASDRAHRIGQTRPVTVYRLVSRQTIEDSILSLHQAKRGLVAGLLEGSAAAGALSTAELAALIEEGAGGEAEEEELPGPSTSPRVAGP